MRTPRLAGPVLATMAAAAFAVAGCDNNTTAGASSSTPPSTPAASASAASSADPAAVKALSDATAKLGTTSFTVTATSGTGFKLTGAIDPVGGNATADLAATGTNASLQVKTLLIGQDLYAQVPGITNGSTWTHVDASRLPDGANIGLRPGEIDPVNTAKLLSSSTDVHTTGTNMYAGTVDITKAAGLAGVDKVTVDQSGAAAQNVPFTATLDDKGMLTELTLTVPQTQPIDVTYTDYGTPVSAAKPASITEAPDSFYTALGGK